MPAGFYVLAGVEINAVARDLDLPEGELHIVGLGVDPASDAFEAALAGQRGEPPARFERMLRDFAPRAGRRCGAGGLDARRGDALGRPTLARALVAAGFATNVQDAFARLVGRGGPGYVAREGLGPRRRDRGDPGRRRHPGARALLRRAVAPRPPARADGRRAGGLEVHHRSFDAATVAAVGAVANELGLFPSGGTDFHGDGETYAEAIAETWVPPEIAGGVLGGARAGIARVTARSLPVLDLLPPVAAAGSPASAASAADERVAEFRPEDQALPRFWIWTLGCQMNRSDSEEMAGRLLAAGCAEAAGMEAADLVVINTCAIREAAEAKVIGRQGALAALQTANPALRMVLTGCAVRERDRAGLQRRFPAVDLFLRPDEEPELVERLGLASAQGPVGLGGAAMGPARATSAVPTAPRTAATTLVKGVPVSAADHLAGSRAEAVASGAVRRESAVTAWLPIIYGCDKTCTYCIVPFSRGPERSRPVRRGARGGALARSRGLSARSRCSARTSTATGTTCRRRRGSRTWRRRGGRAGGSIVRSRPDLAELIRAIDSMRAPDGGPAVPRLRFVTSHPWDLSDRLIDAMAESPSVCAALHLPVQSGDDEVLHRMGRQYTIAHYEERLERIREAIPGIAVSTDVIVGFCGETEAQFGATLRLLETIRYEQVFAAAYSPRPGTPATRLADDVPAAMKKERLNRLLALQEEIGFARNRARIGSVASVLVDSLERERTHDHDEEAARRRAADARRPGSVRRAVAGRLGSAGRPLAREPARPPRRPGGARRGHRRRSDRGRRPVQPAGDPRLTPGEGSARQPRPPLLVVGRADRHRQDRARRSHRARARGRGVHAEVISADSRQVYRGTDVATAKPTAAERRGIPHHGLDLVDPDAPLLRGGLRRACRRACCPPSPRAPASRSSSAGPGSGSRAIADGLALDALPWDPERPRRAGDGPRRARPRCARRASPGRRAGPRRRGRPAQPAPRRAGARDRPPPGRRAAPGTPRLRRAGPAPDARLGDRVRHRAWIARRAAAQLDGGILAEAESLRARYPTTLRAFSAIGYREAWDLLDGRLDRAGYLAANVARNVAYARRQRTWFRSAAVDVQVDAGDPAAVTAAIDRARSFAAQVARGRLTARVRRDVRRVRRLVLAGREDAGPEQRQRKPRRSGSWPSMNPVPISRRPSGRRRTERTSALSAIASPATLIPTVTPAGTPGAAATISRAPVSDRSRTHADCASSVPP